MIFQYSQYSVVLVFVFILLILIFRYAQKKRDSFLMKFWQVGPTYRKKMSSIIYCLGFLFLAISTLDLRGDFKKIKTESFKANVVILLDTSLSMSVEDISPNRFKRSIFLARHLVKKLGSAQIALMIFSDNIKVLSPFTEDLDFLDTRLKALDGLNVLEGGSSISNAINAADLYLSQLKGKGNIVIFSDGEMHFQLKKYKSIKSDLHFVGIGTFVGGKIPVRGLDGSLLHYKKQDGREVISKLNEHFLKRLTSAYNNYNYYMPLNLGVPSEEIARKISLNSSNPSSVSSQNVRPVRGIVLILFGIVLLTISSLLNLGKTYFYRFIFVLLLCSQNIQAEEKKVNIDFLKSGDYSYLDLNKLTKMFFSTKKFKKAILVQKEALKAHLPYKNDPYFRNNLGVTYALSGDVNQAVIELVFVSSTIDDIDKGKIYSNILNSIKQKNKNKKKQDSKKKNKKGKKKGNKDKDKNKKNNKKNKKNKKNNDKKEKNKDKGENTKNINKHKNKDNADKLSEKQKKEKKIKDDKQRKMNEIVNLIKGMDERMQKKYLNTRRRSKRYGVKNDW